MPKNPFVRAIVIIFLIFGITSFGGFVLLVGFAIKETVSEGDNVTSTPVEDTIEETQKPMRVKFTKPEPSKVKKKKVVQPKVDEEENAFWAQNISETFVKRALTAPRTAKFPRLSQKYPEEGVVVNKIGPQKYQVKSWVDSQNAFGAMVRTEYYIELEMKGDQWSASEFFSRRQESLLKCTTTR